MMIPGGAGTSSAASCGAPPRPAAPSGIPPPVPAPPPSGDNEPPVPPAPALVPAVPVSPPPPGVGLAAPDEQLAAANIARASSARTTGFISGRQVARDVRNGSGRGY